MSEAHSKASKARRMKYTPEERSARAKLMAEARWKNTTPKERVKFVKKNLIPNQSRFKE